MATDVIVDDDVDKGAVHSQDWRSGCLARLVADPVMTTIMYSFSGKLAKLRRVMRVVL